MSNSMFQAGKGLLLVVLVVALAACPAPPPVAEPDPDVTPAPEPVELVVLTHWGEEAYLRHLDEKIERYQELNPHVSLDHQTVPFGELLTTIIARHTAGISPDVYHFYNLWLPEFVDSDMLAAPPDELLADIQQNYTPGSVEAVTANGQVWGPPTEINTYLLLYNRRLLEEAGYDQPPATWDELKEVAEAVTQRDDAGRVTQAGFAVITGWDSGVVHPFSSLLWSNGGEYVDVETGAVHFNDEPGVETLQLYLDLIELGAIDMGFAAMDEFPAGTVGMTIMANWWRATLRDAFVDGYENVGVAPVPHTPGNESATLQYNWLFGVSRNSENMAEAWKFVEWMNAPQAAGELSPAGDFLVNALGAIPSRVSDQEAAAEELGDHFLRPFVESTTYAQPEPVVAGGQEVKTRLQVEIEAAWFGEKSAQEALDAAAAEAERILQETLGQ